MCFWWDRPCTGLCDLGFLRTASYLWLKGKGWRRVTEKKYAYTLYSTISSFSLELYCHRLEELERVISEPGAVCFCFHRDFANNKYHQSLPLTLPRKYQGKNQNRTRRGLCCLTAQEKDSKLFSESWRWMGKKMSNPKNTTIKRVSPLFFPHPKSVEKILWLTVASLVTDFSARSLNVPYMSNSVKYRPFFPIYVIFPLRHLISLGHKCYYHFSFSSCS